jgi:hypothetical protein
MVCCIDSPVDFRWPRLFTPHDILIAELRREKFESMGAASFGV